MCEFCTEHGEGKKWYLQMKNYASALLHEDLSASEKEVTGVENRYAWTNRFWENFVMPAVTGTPPAGPFARAETLEQRQVEHFGQVLPIEDVERVIDRVDSITRMPCGCRFLTTGKTDKRYCFGLGIDKWGVLGKFPDACSSLEVLDKEQAKEILRAYDKEGLVHTIWTGVTPYVVGLCNCDRDCGAYKRYIELRGIPYFFRAEYICRIDPDLCSGCKSCFKQCQFAALFYSSGLGKVYIDPTRCFGCGLCRAACPKDAIRLESRQTCGEAADMWLNETPV